MGKNKKFTDFKQDETEIVKDTELQSEDKVIAETTEDNEKTEEIGPLESIHESQIEVVDAVVDGVKMNLNIRQTPEVKPNNQVGILKKGTIIKVVDAKNTVENEGESWYKVLFGNPEQPGYAMKKFIKII